MAKYPTHIIELAKIGAEIQLRDLVQEIRYLIDLFPHLRDSFNEGDLPLRFIIAGNAARASKPQSQRPGRRSPASGAARRASGDRAKRDWSARKKSQKG